MLRRYILPFMCAMLLMPAFPAPAFSADAPDTSVPAQSLPNQTGMEEYTQDPSMAWVTDPKLRIRLAVMEPVGTAAPAAALQRALRDNLSFLPFAALIDPRSVPGGNAQSAASGPQLDFKRYELAGAHTLVTTAWRKGGSPTAELRAFDVTTGKYIFGNSYANVNNETAPDVADAFCAELLKALIGKGDFFQSTIAFIKTGGPMKRDVWTVKPTGRNLRRLTNMPGDALSPAWSPDGKRIAFSHVDVRTHGLGVYDRTTGKVQRIRFPGNVVIGPTFMPNGTILLSLSTGRNPGIVQLTPQLQRGRTVENSSSIDVSPSVDASGSRMAFVSSRMGNPHVFLKNLRSGSVSRLTYSGKYNTEPSISPDGTLVTFSRRTGSGHRIFVYDLESKTETQVSNGPGSDEQPAFAPDGYFISYTSTRGGKKQLYLTTRNGGTPRLIPTGSGDASMSAWGKTARK